MSAAIELVRVQGHALQAISHEGRVWVVVRAVCEALGIDNAGQQKKLQGAAWATVEIMSTVAEDGKDREMFCLDYESLPTWLTNIEPGKVGAHVRPTLKLFQLEAKDALAVHFGLKSDAGITRVISGNEYFQKMEDACARGVEAGMGRALAPIHIRLGELEVEQARQGGLIDQIVPRKDATSSTQKALLAVVARIGGRCPSCHTVPVLVNSVFTGHFDHFYARNRNQPHEMWPICVSCHKKKTNPNDWQDERRPMFDAFQHLRGDGKGKPMQQLGLLCEFPRR